MRRDASICKLMIYWNRDRLSGSENHVWDTGCTILQVNYRWYAVTTDEERKEFYTDFCTEDSQNRPYILYPVASVVDPKSFLERFSTFLLHLKIISPNEVLKTFKSIINILK